MNKRVQISRRREVWIAAGPVWHRHSCLCLSKVPRLKFFSLPEPHQHRQECLCHIGGAQSADWETSWR
jgi:hypothetical protein